MTTQNWAQYFADRITDDYGTCGVIRTQGTNALMEYDTDIDVFRGWLNDGESITDIVWHSDPATGWPDDLR